MLPILSSRALVRSACLIAISMIAAACSQDQGGEPTADAANVGTTAKYDWYMQGTTPAGQTTIVKTGDGRITNESFVHWNNREWTVDAELQLDENGYILSQTISEISPFKAPIDESFAYADGVASWSTPGESGSATTDELAFYVADEGITFGAIGAMIRAAVASMDNEIALFPSGSARVEKVREVTSATPDGEETLSLFAISGIGFTPGYIWMDDEMNVAAFDAGGNLGMIPEGWDVSTLNELSEVQSLEDGDYIERLAGNLATKTDGPVIFENVNVVDVENGVLLDGRHVMVSNGSIKAISESRIKNDEAIRIDGTGKSLMPGMWDMHGHFGLSDGVLNIAGGFTSVRDIGGVHEKVMELTAKFDSGAVIGPNTYRAGFMDKAGPFASGWAAESLDDALEQVDFYAENGYLQIKLYSSIEPEWVAPIAERTHSHGMRLSGHIPAFMSAEQAVSAGYDEIQHINMVFLNFLAGDREDTREQIRFTLYGDEAGNLDLASEEVEDFIALLKENNVVIDATAAIFETMLIHLPGDPDPTFAAVAEHLPPAIGRSLYNPEFDIRETVEAWGRSNVNQGAMLKKLHDNGIQLVPGSDNMPAFTVHRELEIYSESGISNADVLRIATLDSARVVGVADRTGSITVGKDSDLVLIDGNPFEDMSAVRRATLVMKGDTLYRPDELYTAVGVKPFLESADF